MCGRAVIPGSLTHLHRTNLRSSSPRRRGEDQRFPPPSQTAFCSHSGSGPAKCLSSQLLETRPRSDGEVLTLEKPAPGLSRDVQSLPGDRLPGCSRATLVHMGQHVEQLRGNRLHHHVAPQSDLLFLSDRVGRLLRTDHPPSVAPRLLETALPEGRDPLLAWTGIYLILTLITVDVSWNEVGAFLRHNIPLGFSQMYYVIVIFQFFCFHSC